LNARYKSNAVPVVDEDEFEELVEFVEDEDELEDVDEEDALDDDEEREEGRTGSELLAAAALQLKLLPLLTKRSGCLMRRRAAAVRVRTKGEGIPVAALTTARNCSCR